MKIEIEIYGEDLREFEDLISKYKNGEWCDESYARHFAYLIVKYLI